MTGYWPISATGFDPLTVANKFFPDDVTVYCGESPSLWSMIATLIAIYMYSTFNWINPEYTISLTDVSAETGHNRQDMDNFGFLPLSHVCIRTLGPAELWIPELPEPETLYISL